MRTKFWSRVGWLFSAGVMACGQGAESPAEDEQAAEFRAEDPQFPDGPSCSLDAPVEPVICQGVWEFDQHRLCQNQACGCQTFNTCPIPQNTTIVQNFAKPKVCYQECPEDFGKCTTICLPNTTAATAECNTRLATQIALLESNPINDVTSSSSSVQTVSSTAGSNTWKCTMNIHFTETKADASCGCQTLATCRTAACGSEGAFTASPGLARNLVVGEIAGTESCTTCDDLAVATPSQTQAKYECLEQAAARTDLPAVGADIADEVSIAGRQELLLAGAELTAEQQSDAIQLLIGEPGLTPACAEAPALPEVCEGEPIDDSLHARIDACRIIGALDLGADVLREALAQTCLPLPDVVAREAAIDAGCRDALLDALLQEQEVLLDRAFAATIQYDAVQDSFSGLVEALALVESWYADAILVADDDVVEGAASRIVAMLWRRSHEAMQIVPTSVATAQEADALQSLLFETGLRVEREMLVAAFSPATPLRSAPLLLVVADALTGIADRIESRLPVHDLACRYLDGCDTVTTETTGLVRLLAALPSATTLTGELAQVGASQESYAGPDYDEVFAAIRTQHAVLDAALVDATGTEPAPSLTDVDAPMARSLRNVVTRAQALASNYAATGLFAPEFPAKLHSGMQTQVEASLFANLDLRRSLLGAAVDEYQQNRLASVSALLSQLGNQAEKVSAIDAAARLAVRFDQLSGDLDGLALREAVEEGRFDAIGASLEALLASGSVDPGARVVAETDALSLSAADAVYKPGDERTLDAMTVASADFRAIDAEPGDIVRFDVSGLWSPSCAIQGLPMPGPGGASTPLSVPVGALTDSGGYTASFSQGVFTADSVSDAVSAFESTQSSREGCLGASLEADLLGVLGLSAADFATVGVSATGRLCRERAHGESSTSTDQSSSGREDRTQAAFSAGLRSPDAPVPFAPAGSLVAVVMPAGEGGSIAAATDVRVVRDGTAIFVAEPSDVYLVVNDSAQCEQDAAASLTVDITRTTSVEGQVGHLAEVLPVVLQELASLELAAVGSPLLPEERAAAAADARNAIALAGIDVARIPAPIAAFVDSVILRELARIERRGHMTTLLRETDLLQAELATIADDAAAAGDRGRVIDGLVRLSLRHLAARELAFDEGALVEALQDFALPVLEIRYPSALAQVRADPSLSTLLEAPLAAPAGDVDELADGVAELAEAVVVAHGAVGFDSLREVADVMVVVPRSVGPDTSSAGHIAAVATLGGFPTIDPVRADAFWNAVLAGDPGQITLTPEDLYEGDGGSSVLLCYANAPVIEDMALFVATRAILSPPLSNFHVPVDFDAQFDFVTADSLVRYELADDDWLSLGPPLRGDAAQDIFDPATGLLAALNDNEIRGNGLSPITTFSIELGALDAPSSDVHPTNTDAIVIGMRVSYILGDDATYVSTCE